MDADYRPTSLPKRSLLQLFRFQILWVQGSWKKSMKTLCFMNCVNADFVSLSNIRSKSGTIALLSEINVLSWKSKTIRGCLYLFSGCCVMSAQIQPEQRVPRIFRGRDGPRAPRNGWLVNQSLLWRLVVVHLATDCP